LQGWLLAQGPLCFRKPLEPRRSGSAARVGRREPLAALMEFVPVSDRVSHRLAAQRKARSPAAGVPPTGAADPRVGGARPLFRACRSAVSCSFSFEMFAYLIGPTMFFTKLSTMFFPLPAHDNFVHKPLMAIYNVACTLQRYLPTLS